MKKPTVVLAAATFLATLAVAYVWAQLQSARARGAELSVRITALESAPQPVLPPAVATAVLPKSAQVPGTNPAIDRQPATSARVAATPAPAVAKPEPESPMKALFEAAIAAEARNSSPAQRRASMSRIYPDLAAEVGLSEDEANRFLDLLGSGDDDSGDEMMAMMEGTPPGSAAREALLRRMDETQRAHEARQSAMLGSKYTKWQDYKYTISARNEIRQLSTLFATGDHPLTDAQAQQLLPALVAEHRRIEQLQRDWTTSPAAIQAPDLMQAAMVLEIDRQQGLVDAVSRHLTAAQAEQYRRKHEQELAMMRAMMGMFGAGGTPPPGPPGRTQP